MRDAPSPGSADVERSGLPSLPFGVTFTGRAFDEKKLIALAYAFEQATGHRVPPTSAPTRPADTIPLARSGVVPIGAGCAGSNGVPTIQPVGPPILGNGVFTLRMASLRPLARLAVAAGLAASGLTFAAGDNQAQLKELRARIERAQRELAAAEGSRTEARDGLAAAEKAVSEAHRAMFELSQSAGRIEAELAAIAGRLREARAAIATQETAAETATALKPIDKQASNAACRRRPDADARRRLIRVGVDIQGLVGKRNPGAHWISHAREQR